MRAGHLVAPIVLDEGPLAFIAVAYQSSRHGFLDDVPDGEAFVLFRLLATQWDMGLFMTETTARLSAFWVQAAEFPVFVHGGTLLLEIAKGTFVEIQTRYLQVLHLLHMFESVESNISEAVLQLATGKAAAACRIREAHRPAF